MKYVALDHMDGRFHTTELTQDEATRARRDGARIVEVEDRVYNAWQRHLDDGALWNATWNALSKTRDR